MASQLLKPLGISKPVMTQIPQMSDAQLIESRNARFDKLKSAGWKFNKSYTTSDISSGKDVFAKEYQKRRAGVPNTVLSDTLGSG